MRWRTGFGLAGLIGAAVLTAPPASSQQVCLQLESQLAALERQSSQVMYQAVLAQYEQARLSYDQTFRQADQMGCIPRLFRRQVPASCNAIQGQLDATLAELTQLQQQLRLFNPTQNAADVAAILEDAIGTLHDSHAGPV